MIDGFLNSSESDTPLREEVDRDAIGIKGITFTWDAGSASGTSTPGTPKRNFKLRIDEEVMFKRGGINLIVGPTGAGKTSLLMALLGEMHRTPLRPDSLLALPRAQGVAYHAQESWILNDTIRVSVGTKISSAFPHVLQSNVLFGSTYNEERYKKGGHDTISLGL